MKVLMMVSWYGAEGDKLVGGNFHYELAKELQNKCEIAIYYPYDRNITSKMQVKEEWGIKTYRSKYQLQNKIRNRVYLYQTMKKIVDEFHPDLIHAQVATEVGRFAIMLGQIFHIPVMITEHSSADASGVRSFPHHMYAKRVYRYSKYNACVSDRLTQDLQEIFPEYSFHTVYNGIVSPNITKKQKTEKETSSTEIHAAMVASFYDEWIKGFHLVLPALQKLRKEGVNLILHLIGDGDYRASYQKMAEELEISEACIFHGFCEKQQVYEILAEMDFLICASSFESFSCAVAEALMIGLPVLSSRCGGPECMVNPETGILVDKDDSQKLYEGMKEMVYQYPNYDTRKIIDFAKEHFTVERIAEQYIGLYEEILQKN